MPTVTIWHATWCAPCKGTIERVVPRLREEGVEPALAGVDLRPCAARDRYVDYLPTVTVDDGGDRLAPALPWPPHGGGDRARRGALRVGVARDGGPTRASET